MPTAHATVATTRSSRYLVQLCRHVDQVIRPVDPLGGHRHPSRAHDPAHTRPGPEARVTWSDTTGVLDLGWGRCALQATDDALVLHAEADSGSDLHRLQTQLADRLHRIGRRDHLTVEWEPAATPAPLLTAARPLDATSTGRRGARRRAVALVAVGVLVVALHLGLGAAVLAPASWARPTVDVVLAAVAVKLLASIVLGRRLVHHRRRPSPPTPPERADA